MPTRLPYYTGGGGPGDPAVRGGVRTHPAAEPVLPLGEATRCAATCWEAAAPQGPFDRLFGGWLPALQAAGVVSGDAPARPPGNSNGQVRPSGYGFTTEQIRDALREVADVVGRAPRTTEYTRERAELLDQQDATGKPLRAMPSYHVINDRYATWDEALTDAGLEPLGGRGTTSNPPKELKRSKRVSNEQILAALHEAYTELGDPFTTSAYARWRSRQQEEDRQAGRYRNLPHWDTARDRFGTWAKAMAAVRRLGEMSE